MMKLNEKQLLSSYFVGSICLDEKIKFNEFPRQDYVFLTDPFQNDECWCIGKFENGEWIKCKIQFGKEGTPFKTNTPSSKVLVSIKAPLSFYMSDDEKSNAAFGITPNQAYSIWSAKLDSLESGKAKFKR